VDRDDEENSVKVLALEVLVFARDVLTV